MKIQIQGTRPITAVGMVLVALFVPFFVGVAVETVTGVGLVLIILMGVLWFLATIGLGVRFGTWRALFLAVVPGLVSLFWTIFLVVSTGGVEYIEVRYVLLIEAIVALIWLAGIAVGVFMRNVFRRPQFFP